jgi:hypothetical protein
MLAPVDKMRLGEAYTFEYAVDNIFPALDSSIERQINSAFSFAENARVTRTLFDDKLKVSFIWRGPAISVSEAANNLAMAASSTVQLQFRSANLGFISDANLPCEQRGPVDSITCKIGEAGKAIAGTVIGLTILLIAAIVVVAFSPAGKEAIKRIPRVTSG